MVFSLLNEADAGAMELVCIGPIDRVVMIKFADALNWPSCPMRERVVPRVGQSLVLIKG